jgi:hypothetical protein
MEMHHPSTHLLSMCNFEVHYEYQEVALAIYILKVEISVEVLLLISMEVIECRHSMGSILGSAPKTMLASTFITGNILHEVTTSGFRAE